MCRHAKIPAMTRGGGVVQRWAEGCRRRVVLYCGLWMCGACGLCVAHWRIAPHPKASQRKHREQAPPRPPPPRGPPGPRAPPAHPADPSIISARLHSPLALTAWQLRSRFVTCTRPRLRTQGNKKDLICCFLGHLKRSSHLLILSSLSTSSSSPTRKALCIDTAHEQQADTR